MATAPFGRCQATDSDVVECSPDGSNCGRCPESEVRTFVDSIGCVRLFVGIDLYGLAWGLTMSRLAALVLRDAERSGHRALAAQRKPASSPCLSARVDKKAHDGNPQENQGPHRTGTAADAMGQRRQNQHPADEPERLATPPCRQ